MENMFTENVTNEEVTTNEVDNEESLPVAVEESNDLFTENKEEKPEKKSNGGLMVVLGIGAGVGLTILGKKLYNVATTAIANRKAKKAAKMADSDAEPEIIDVASEAAMADDNKKKSKRK